MPTTITITLEETLTEEQRRELQYTLSDALYEFRGARLPAAEYVAKRYTDAVYPLGNGDVRRAAKVAQVERRCQLAHVLWDAVLRNSNLKVE